MINKENYEKYAIDYLEGTLSPHLVEEFEDFLSKNPDIFDQLQDIKSIFIEPEQIQFNDKIDLKHSSVAEDISYFEELCIRYLENDLTHEEKKQLQDAVQLDKEKKIIFLEYQHTKLHPPTVFYPYKSKLKRSSQALFISSFLKIAAIFILFFSVFSYLNHPQNLLSTNVNSLIYTHWALILDEPNFSNFQLRPGNRRTFIADKTTDVVRGKNKIYATSADFYKSSADNLVLQSKKFDLGQLPQSIVVNDFQSLRSGPGKNYKTEILNKIVENVTKTFDKQIQKRDIKLTKDGVIITIDKKSYGICWR